MLKELLKKTELKAGDSLKTAFGRGALEGMLDGLVIVGAITILSGILENKKWEQSNWGQLY